MLVSLIGDTSSHGGSIITGSDTTSVQGQPVAREGDLHVCPIQGHGTTSLSSIQSKLIIDGKPAITVGAVAGCGAVITSGTPKFEVS